MAQAAFWKADWFIGLSVLLMLLLVGLVLLAAKRLGKMGGNKEKQPAESAEAKRMLGLAFQGQGQLDKAFDKFRECPMNEGLMENIYNLALDYERQRQFKKSETVFRYLSAHNPSFRDLPARLRTTAGRRGGGKHG
jgi:tetratricopeptide (TPR) repeat protein